MTHLTSLEVAGVPTMGLSGVPVPFTGNYFFVNESTGADGNAGQADSPMATLSAALGRCTSGNNDVVLFSGTIHLTATLTWNKNQTHLIGICEPLRRGKRARISVSGSTAFAPLVNVTANGCYFSNFGTFYGFSSASNNTVCWAEAGARNCYDNVEFMGFGDGTVTTGTSNITGARALTVGSAGGNGENTFRSCVLGVDTTTRNATNYTMEFTSGSGTPRNYFIDCDFEALLGSSGTAAAHIRVAASSSLDRYQVFDRCRFHNCVKSGGSAMAQAANLAASAGGYILMKDCTFVGVTHIETTPTNQIFIDGAAPTAATSGLAVNNA